VWQSTTAHGLSPLPALPALPVSVQADRWLFSLHHRVFARAVGADGCVAVNHETEYLSTTLKGHQVALSVDAAEGSLSVSDGAATLQVLPIKGLVRGNLALDEFFAGGSFPGTTAMGSLGGALASQERASIG
jgi:hypothetical protein